MIISHEHRFVFLKTQKTAGTSIEVLLERYVEPGAIVTPIEPPVAGHTPRNHQRPFNPVPEMLATRRVRAPLSDLKRHRTFFNHIDATRARARLGRKRWDSYFKFCFDRDPWDKTVSWYYWQTRFLPERPSFRDFVLTDPLPSDLDRYSTDGEVAMDFIGRFEHLDADLAVVMDRLGFTDVPSLSREKARSRPVDAGVDPLYTEELDDRVASVFARELVLLGYTDRRARGAESSAQSGAKAPFSRSND